jgi:hypothetical protein
MSEDYVVISKNQERNMQMIVKGGKTMHVPIEPDQPIKPKKKGWQEKKKTKKGGKKKKDA